MPLYGYDCPKCHAVTERFASSDRMPKSVKCRTCHEARAMRVIGARVAPPGNWPMKSDALGVDPSQIREATEHATRIGIPTEFDSKGRAIFRDPAHRRRYCEHSDIRFFDRDGGYSDPQRR